MSTTDLRILTEKYVAAFHLRDLSTVGTLLADDFVLEDPAGRFMGKTAVLDYLQGIVRSCATLQFVARQIIVEGNRSVIEFVLNMDDVRLVGTDVIEWEGDKMQELRAYLYAQPSA